MKCACRGKIEINTSLFIRCHNKINVITVQESFNNALPNIAAFTSVQSAPFWGLWHIESCIIISMIFPRHFGSFD